MSTVLPSAGVPFSPLPRRYELDGLLGGGSSGVVYAAVDRLLERRVAIKEFTAGPDGWDPVQHAREAAALASVHHPSIVALHDVLLDVLDGEVAVRLVMELVDGADLRARITAGPSPVSDVLAIGADIAAGVAHLHVRGLVHCDIKPANVLVLRAPSAGEPRAKLADFGVARRVAADRDVVSESGSAAYLSPEQAARRPITPASDVYALGLTLLEALTGLRGHPGDLAETVARRLQSLPVGLEEAPAPLRALLTDMCALQPRRRPDAVEVERTLRLLAADASATDRPLEFTDDGLIGLGVEVGADLVYHCAPAGQPIRVALRPAAVSAAMLTELLADLTAARGHHRAVVGRATTTRVPSGTVGVLRSGRHLDPLDWARLARTAHSVSMQAPPAGRAPDWIVFRCPSPPA